MLPVTSIVRFGRKPGFEIIKIPPVDYSTTANLFLRDWIPQLTTNRAGVIQQAEKLTGFKIHDFGNFSPNNLEIFLMPLIRMVHEKDDQMQIPAGIKHIVLGHGDGIGEKWHFLNSTTRVQQFINERIPKGEKAWAVVCDSYHARNIHQGIGKVLTSAGSPRQHHLKTILDQIKKGFKTLLSVIVKIWNQLGNWRRLFR